MKFVTPTNRNCILHKKVSYGEILITQAKPWTQWDAPVKVQVDSLGGEIEFIYWPKEHGDKDIQAAMDFISSFIYDKITDMHVRHYLAYQEEGHVVH